MQVTQRSPRRFSHINKAVHAIRNTDGSADLIARSFSIGTFIALLPTFGFGIVIAGLLLLFFASLNRPAIIAAFAVWNPLVQIPLYILSFEIGIILYGNAPVVAYDIEFLNQVFTITQRVLIGNFIITSCITMISYLTVFFAIRIFKHKPLLPWEKSERV